MFLYPLGLLALASVPVVVALHLFRRRFRPHVVSAVFLWAAQDRLPLAGRRREHLRTHASFWCETVAALLLGLAFAGPRIFGAGEAVHLVVVLDGSASMAARTREGVIADRALELVRDQIEALPSGSRVTLIESGRRPAIRAGPAAFTGEARDALDRWEPNGASHAISPAVALGSQLAGGGRVLLVTDHYEPEAWPPEIEIEALGEPTDNVAITHASRRRSQDPTGEESERVDLTIANSGAGARPVRLALVAEEIELETREIVIAARSREHVAFRLPRDTPLLVARIDGDALAIDDRAFLAPLPPRTLALASTLDLDTARRLGLSRPGGSSIARWLESVSGTIEAPDAASAHLVIASGALPPGASWCLSLESRGSERRPWIGPFVLDRRHPLLDGVTLDGIVWSGSIGAPLAGVPVISAGSEPLLSEDEVAGRRIFRMDFDPASSTLQRSPDWPILLANLAEMRRAELPGPARTNLAVGESFRYFARESADYRLEGPGGIREIAARTVLEIDAIEEPGVYVLSDASGASGASGPLCTVAYSFCDAAESDLSGLGSGSRASSSAAATLRAGFSWIELLLVGSALALFLVDWLVLARVHARAGEAILPGAATTGSA